VDTGITTYTFANSLNSELFDGLFLPTDIQIFSSFFDVHENSGSFSGDNVAKDILARQDMESIPVAVRALETDTYEFTSNC
jgi:hypothetical protein